MALRDDLIATRRDDVIAVMPEAREAAHQLLVHVLDHVGQDVGYRVDDGTVTRPDGIKIRVDHEDPLGTVGRLVQEDFCLMQKPAGSEAHILTGAVLCFPAGWVLADKIGRPLIGIHQPVPAYDDDLARRVQRLFDGVREGHPMWRFNALGYVDPALYQPRKAGAPKHGDGPAPGYIRSERQTVYRLPNSGAVVFGIHTFVIRNPS
jgi:hypothetical protein